MTKATDAAKQASTSSSEPPRDPPGRTHYTLGEVGAEKDWFINTPISRRAYWAWFSLIVLFVGGCGAAVSLLLADIERDDLRGFVKIACIATSLLVTIYGITYLNDSHPTAQGRKHGGRLYIFAGVLYWSVITGIVPVETLQALMSKYAQDNASTSSQDKTKTSSQPP